MLQTKLGKFHNVLLTQAISFFLRLTPSNLTGLYLFIFWHAKGVIFPLFSSCSAF
uniref:Uncharacterized protein n=1 Tax=Rhizophora mucronata TaxID=61149 RepID=A0A2P2Q3L8_RHIMU